MSLRQAVLISTAIHLSFIGPSFCNVNLPRILQRDDKTMVVDYVVIKEPEKAEAAKKEPEIKMAEPSMQETPKLDIDKKVEVRPAPPAVKREAAKAAQRPAEEAALRTARKQAEIKSTKDYVNYFTAIREKIRQRLKANYKHYYSEGEVLLAFTLNADGTLGGLDADRARSTADRTLTDIATSSIREASPFPRFPKAMSLPQMNFNLIVSFKKE